ncbi:MAG: hypothetical protein JWO19_4213 [Bryobacterales bacterium]|nr:hypothetical protein [Bryobacterales bacterium]
MQSEGFDETSVSILLAAVCGAGSSTLLIVNAYAYA